MFAKSSLSSTAAVFMPGATGATVTESYMQQQYYTNNCEQMNSYGMGYGYNYDTYSQDAYGHGQQWVTNNWTKKPDVLNLDDFSDLSDSDDEAVANVAAVAKKMDTKVAPPEALVMECGSAEPAEEPSPCDFDGEKLVLVDRSRGLGPPLFRIVHLERNQHTEVDNLPSADSMTLLKLWGASYLVCAQHRNLVVYDYEDQAVKLTINSNGSEIMAVDSQDPEILATLDRDATAKLWNGRTGECMAKVHIPDAHYHMGYPYCLCVSGHRIVLSADEGVFLAELDDVPGVP